LIRYMVFSRAPVESGVLGAELILGKLCSPATK
jgi:hypothetical protein